MTPVDVLIIGAGQAGLATAYYLRRFPLQVQLVDARPAPGGSWPDTWESLALFSPWRISSLPGWRLPATKDYYPTPAEIIDYFTAYEHRYGFDITRGVHVRYVSASSPFQVTLSDGTQRAARAIINCTGNASRPFIPYVPGINNFTGIQLHSHDYRCPDSFAGMRVAVVGGGNSGAQIAADLIHQAQVTWCTLRPPRFLPDNYDGEALFSVARQRLAALERGEPDTGGLAALGDIVAVPPVRAARSAGVLNAHPMFASLTEQAAHWPDGRSAHLDAIIWCTGFRPALAHLSGCNVAKGADHRPLVDHTESTNVSGMYFVGYGDWVGPAADTILGVAPFAKMAAYRAAEFLRVREN
ncbi:ArsO family NAD(P)H-dependent flavin-containing monooxygenase [Staphylococcus chromogenes]|nr:ArsO family NAD(P)H-dependent flavin-containing monooxygenase [Staphylococcus chromogenes]